MAPDMSVNTDGVFLGAKHALTLMRERQPGSIVSVSSIAGLIASHNFANHNASKAAVWLLSKSIALRRARQGWDIRCNSVHPAFVRTPILNDLVGDRDEATVQTKLAKQGPHGRLGEPDDVATRSSIWLQTKVVSRPLPRSSSMAASPRCKDDDHQLFRPERQGRARDGAVSWDRQGDCRGAGGRCGGRSGL
jgi:NAD(P)-dependent dehydrogenase (short-subunit alcohol dehydrogenase family)